MQEVFEKIINNKVLEKAWQPLGMFDEHSPLVIKVEDVKEIVKQEAEEYYKEKYFNLDHATLHKCPKCGADAEHRVNRKGLWACGCFECNLFKTSYDHGKAVDEWEDFGAEYNNGWIPCSERLPERNKPVLCWVISKTIASGETYIIGSCDNGFWFLQTYEIGHHHFPVKDYEVIAWQPLPPEYQSKGE